MKVSQEYIQRSVQNSLANNISLHLPVNNCAPSCRSVLKRQQNIFNKTVSSYFTREAEVAVYDRLASGRPTV